MVNYVSITWDANDVVIARVHSQNNPAGTPLPTSGGSKLRVAILEVANLIGAPNIISIQEIKLGTHVRKEAIIYYEAEEEIYASDT